MVNKRHEILFQDVVDTLILFFVYPKFATCQTG